MSLINLSKIQIFILILVLSFILSKTKKHLLTEVNKSHPTPSESIISESSSSSVYSNVDGKINESIKNKSFKYSDINGKKNKSLHGSEFDTKETNENIEKYGEIYYKRDDEPMHIQEQKTSSTEKNPKKNNKPIKKIANKEEEEKRYGKFSKFYKSSKKSNKRKMKEIKQ